MTFLEDCHMLKLTYIYHKFRSVALFAALTALLSAGCSQSDEPGGNPNHHDRDVVSFGAYVSNSAATRASISNIHTLKKSGFGVFATITGTHDFEDNSSSALFIPNYMRNQKVVWQEFAERDSAWVYEPELFWPGAQKVSFFAYAPYADKANASVIKWLETGDAASPSIKYTLSDQIDRQVDLLYANAFNLVNSPQVPLNFKHALSRISIQFDVDDDIDPNTSISVKQLTFKSNDLGSAGVLNLGTGTWSNITGSISHEYTATDTDAMKKGFMVIPPGKVANLVIATDYTLTTIDSKLPEGSFKIDNYADGLFSIGLEAGKSYCLKLHLTLNAIKITTSIHDWDGDNHTWESDQNHDNKLE